MTQDGFSSSDLHPKHELIEALCDERITPEQMMELDKLVREDAEFRRHYIRQMHLHASLYEHASVLDGGRMLSRHDPLRRYVYQTAIAAGLALAVVAGIIWALATHTVAGPSVATVTASSDSLLRVGHGIPAGQTLNLYEGCVEFVFAGGCRAIVEGPAEFTVVSGTELDLDRGKISATMKGGGFVVRTPTGIVTDLGTKFGVSVNFAGTTEVDVFEGRVAAAARRADSGIQPVLLKQGQAAVLSASAITLDSSGAVPQRFVTRMESDAKVLDLVDLISGGDGTTQRRGTAIDAMTGSFGKLHPVGQRVGDYQYHRVPSLTVIDGAFVPDGKKGATTIDSAGHQFVFPVTSDISINFIWTGGEIPWFTRNGISMVLNGEDYSTSNHAALSLHSNNALTIDLNAIRRLFPDHELSRLTCGIGNSYVKGYRGETAIDPKADVYVIIDGKSRFEKHQFGPADGMFNLDLSIGASDRFMTLATTDGGDGINDDWVLWVDPHLYLSSW